MPLTSNLKTFFSECFFRFPICEPNKMFKNTKNKQTKKHTNTFLASRTVALDFKFNPQCFVSL